MKDSLKICVVGAGRATKELTLPALKVLKSEAVCLGICDTSPGKASTVVGTGMRAYDNLETMLSTEKTDVLIVNTPVPTHHEIALAGIRHGANVIVEKPAASTLQELEEIRSAAEKKGVKACVVHNYKFMPGPYEAWRMYQAGELGDILHIDRVWMSPPQHDRMERNPHGWWHRILGGRLADSLPHHLYISYPYIGDMSLEYVGVRKLAKDRSWSKCDEAEIILKAARAYLNIRMSINQVSWPSKGATYHAILWGTKRNLIVHQDEAAFLPHGDPKYWMRMGWSKLLDRVKSRFRLNKSDRVTRGAHNRFFQAFFEHLRGKGPLPTSWDEAMVVMRLCDEIGMAMESELREKIE